MGVSGECLKCVRGLIGGVCEMSGRYLESLFPAALLDPTASPGVKQGCWQALDLEGVWKVSDGHLVGIKMV